MPEPSPAIETALRAWLDAKMRGDREEVVALLSTEPGVIAVGTDENEWYIGPEAFVEAHRDGAPFEAEIVSLDAFAEATAGWAVARAAIALADDQRLPVRLSVVLVRRDDEWRVVHTHASIGQDAG